MDGTFQFPTARIAISPAFNGRHWGGGEGGMISFWGLFCKDSFWRLFWMILFEDSCRNSHKDPFCHVIFSGFSSLKILFGTIFRGSSLFLPTDYKRIDGILTRHGLGDALDAVRCVLILLSLIRLQLVGHRLELGNQDDLGLRNGDHQLPFGTP